jgi:hypothetical protein
VSRCATCGAPIRWAVHERTGWRAPLDASPDMEGPIALLPDGERYRVVAPAERTGSFPDDPRFTNHWQTCPGREEWKARAK